LQHLVAGPGDSPGIRGDGSWEYVGDGARDALVPAVFGGEVAEEVVCPWDEVGVGPLALHWMRKRKKKIQRKKKKKRQKKE
jgi:hypothetical protein